MRNARFWRLAVIITTVGGLSLGAAGTALAGGGARSDLGVTIATTSAFMPVTGDTLVRFGAPFPADSANVSGSVTGIPPGLTSVTVTLLAKPFGATAFASTGVPATLRAAGGTAAYTFPVRPTVATSYEVAVSQAAGSATLRTSGPQTVYVIPDVTVTGLTCARPSCSGQLVITAQFPPSAFARESAKKLNVYQGLRESPDRTPAEPDQLSLAGPPAHVVTDATKSTVQYTVRYGFNVGRAEGYQWKINYCTQDTESADGMGLPGDHFCGDKKISTDDPYLG
jgi:hypothetical protein